MSIPTTVSTADGAVFDLPVLRASTWMFTCYALLGEDGHSVLVDPGLPSSTTGALDLLLADGRSAGDVDALVVTHGHTDHLAGVPEALAVSRASTHLPDRCRQYLAGEEPRSFGLDSNVRFLPMMGQHPFSLGAVRELAAGSRTHGYGGRTPDFRFPHDDVAFLADGDELPGAPGWRVVATPGHTDDSVAFHHAGSATLLSGDAVLTHDGRAWFNPEWVDADASDETEERLRALEVRHLLPGHGHPITGDVWATARSRNECPPGKGLLTRCARRFGKWNA